MAQSRTLSISVCILLLIIACTTTFAATSDAIGPRTKNVVASKGVASLESQDHVHRHAVPGVSLSDCDDMSTNLRHRKLPVEDVGQLVSQLFETPVRQWTGEQWLVLLVLLVLVSILLRCLCGSCCRPSYHYRGNPGGYYGGGGSRGGSSCFSCSDIFWCLCCYEWCCRDCQDVEACCNGGAANVYQGGEMV